MKKYPRISCALLTYNRAHLVEKALASLFRQSFQDFEVLLIDNGSTDSTPDLLKRYQEHPQIRVFRLEENRGFPGGMNFAFDQMRGEWFVQLGDDDELVEEAFESLMQVADMDPQIGTIICNVVDTATGKLTGKGLDQSGYLEMEDIVGKRSATNWWGATRADLIGKNRFNEQLTHYDHVFWRNVQEKAPVYYLHKGLLLWCTDHGATLTRAQQKASLHQKAGTYAALLGEAHHWDLLAHYRRSTFLSQLLKGMYFLKADRHFEEFQKYRKKLFDAHPPISYRFFAKGVDLLPPGGLSTLFLTFKTLKNTWQRAVGKI